MPDAQPKRRIRRRDQTTLARLDRRTKASRLTRRIRAELLAQIGPAATPAQIMLVERIVTLRLHVERFDAKAAENDGLNEHDRKAYLAYSNSLTRALRTLGLQATAQRTPTLAEHVARNRAAVS
jgi:hypothetical protein